MYIYIYICTHVCICIANGLEQQGSDPRLEGSAGLLGEDSHTNNINNDNINDNDNNSNINTYSNINSNSNSTARGAPAPPDVRFNKFGEYTFRRISSVLCVCVCVS